jgi:hypothetical protein
MATQNLLDHLSLWLEHVKVDHNKITQKKQENGKMAKWRTTTTTFETK